MGGTKIHLLFEFTTVLITLPSRSLYSLLPITAIK